MARNEFKKKRIGPLDCLVAGGDEASATVILFHGYGADMSDLAPLADVVQAPKGTRWIFPNGHCKVDIGPHATGRGWFPISLADLEAADRGGKGFDFSNLIPPGFKKARELAGEFLAQLAPNYASTVIGGFSQGAMLATDLVLRAESRPAGLAILSGTLLNANEWESLAKKTSGFQFFQSHGEQDQVLPMAPAQQLNQLLKRAGWQGELMRFRGGHEIPSEVLMQFASYLRRVLPKTF